MSGYGRRGLGLRPLAWVEVAAGVLLLGIAVHPFTRYCSGIVHGFDCESRAILGLNLVAPLGLVCLLCGIWLLRTRSLRSQIALVVGAVGIGLYILSHVP